MQPKILLTVPEAAQLLSIGKTKAYELAASGQIPTVRIGRCVRIPTDALQDWLKSRTSTEPDWRGGVR